MNPFVVNGLIPDNLFCDRVLETERITKAIQNNTNILLTSPRRMGKTQLLRHVFAQKGISENYFTFYTDIFATTSLSELVIYLGKEIYAQIIPQGRKSFDSFIAALKSLSGSFTYDPLTGIPSFNVRLGDIKLPELTLEEIFDYLNNAEKPCIYAIDEFQRVGSYSNTNVEALLRTHIQECTNCCFIFAGSNRHILENMFNSSSKPFYNSASQMYLDRIERETYVQFIRDKFSAQGRAIDQDAAYYAYDLFEGHTYYVHSLLHDTFTYTDPTKRVTKETLDRTLDNIIEDRAHSFADQMSRLNYQQKEVLIAIAKENKATGVTSVSFIKRYSLTSPSSVQNALRILVDRDIVTYNSNVRSKEYSISDRYFALWLKKSY